MELSKYEDQVATPVPSDETRMTTSGPSAPSTSRPSSVAATSNAQSAPSAAGSSSKHQRREVRIEMDTDEIEAEQRANGSLGREPTPPSPSQASTSTKSNEFVTSREPLPGEQGSSNFATPADVGSPTKVSGIRKKTFSKDGPAVKIADIKLAAADIKYRATSLWDTAKPRFNELYEVLWRLLEIHMMKVVFVAAITVAVIDVS